MHRSVQRTRERRLFEHSNAAQPKYRRCRQRDYFGSWAAPSSQQAVRAVATARRGRFDLCSAQRRCRPHSLCTNGSEIQRRRRVGDQPQLRWCSEQSETDPEHRAQVHKVLIPAWVDNSPRDYRLVEALVTGNAQPLIGQTTGVVASIDLAAQCFPLQAHHIEGAAKWLPVDSIGPPLNFPASVLLDAAWIAGKSWGLLDVLCRRVDRGS